LMTKSLPPTAARSRCWSCLALRFTSSGSQMRRSSASRSSRIFAQGR
jgi:hypothetical protein